MTIAHTRILRHYRMTSASHAGGGGGGGEGLMVIS